MAKAQRKQQKRLTARITNFNESAYMRDNPGFHVPGSQNKKK